MSAERTVNRCDFADFGNSPSEYSENNVKGKEIAFTSSNGTRAIKASANCYRLLIGAFVNLRAVALRCMQVASDRHASYHKTL